MELDNCQLILVGELQREINKLKDNGADYPRIKDECRRIGEQHWLVTNPKLRDEAVAAALYVYAMGDNQREITKIIADATGQIIV